jgi:hypothetical protein|nr:MAG TPA: Protein of unknown function (DUF2577) [Caudoviricetes sp.]
MSNQLMNALQKLAYNTYQAGKPADYILGVVETVDPLVIRLDAKETITEEFLVLTDAVRDYDVDITVNHTTENAAGGSGYAEYASHNHGYKGRKRITVHNGLTPGESVVMLRQLGGQEYLVISRIFNHITLSGQWG